MCTVLTNNDLHGKKYFVLGLARSGYAVARLLHKHGADVVVNDYHKLTDDPRADALRQLGIEVIDGGHPVNVLDKTFAMVVKNPGIRYDNVMVQKGLALGLPVVTEVEIAGQLSAAPFVAITGSNGKTTTTTLIGNILKQDEQKALVAGNIGTVVSDFIENATEEHLLITELSSFQLLGTEHFHPYISVFLNIFSAHLDYHGNMANYKRAKAKIFANQTADDFAVLNADDHDVMQLAERTKAQKVLFSTNQVLTEGVYADEHTVYVNQSPIIDRTSINLPGEHNLENILAAIAVTTLLNVRQQSIIEVLRTFNGVKHRLQYVDTVAGRLFYNDSKATNILATQKAVDAFVSPVILIAGGLDRGNDFAELAPSLAKLKGIIVYGQTADALEAEARRADVSLIRKTANLQQATQEAYQHAADDDVVLLSPACASWDQFATFEERGDAFIRTVHQLTS